MVSAGEGRGPELLAVAARRRYPSPVVKQELAKLGGKQAESRRSALVSLRTVVEEHLQSGGALQRFVQQVEESEDGRQNAAGIVAELARVHGPRLEPLFHRLLAILLHTMLASAAQPALQAECARAVEALAIHAAPTEESLRHLCLPLMALLPHKVQPLSACAAACLAALVESPPWRRLSPSSAALVSELCIAAAAALPSPSAHTVPHLSLLKCLATSNAISLAPFAAPLIRLLPSILLPPTPSSWKLRVAALRLLHALLPLPDAAALSPILRPSLLSLAACRLDKVPHVRNAAVDALRTAHSLTSSNVDDLLLLQPPSPRSPSRHRSPRLSVTSPVRHSRDTPASPPHGRPLLRKQDSRSPVATKVTVPPPQSCASLRSQQLDSDLYLSPRTLCALNVAAAASSPVRASEHRQPISGTDTPVSIGRRTAADDDSDYFCAYFLYDNKDKISCRKIVHHIHDTATATTTATTTAAAVTPPGTPPSIAAAAKVPVHSGNTKRVPPLPLLSMRKAFERADADYKKDSDLSCYEEDDDEDEETPLSSVTRQVRVLESHEQLLASCGVDFASPLQQHFSNSSCISEPNAQKASVLLPDIMTKIVEADERDYGNMPVETADSHGVAVKDHCDDASAVYSARSSSSSAPSCSSVDDGQKVPRRTQNSKYVDADHDGLYEAPPPSSDELPLSSTSALSTGAEEPLRTAENPDARRARVHPSSESWTVEETEADETEHHREESQHKLQQEEEEVEMNGREGEVVMQAVSSTSETEASSSAAAVAAEWSVRDNPIAVDAQAVDQRKQRRQSQDAAAGGEGVNGGSEEKKAGATHMDMEWRPRRLWRQRWNGGALARIVFSGTASTAIVVFSVAKLLQPLYSQNAMPPT